MDLGDPMREPLSLPQDPEPQTPIQEAAAEARAPPLGGESDSVRGVWGSESVEMVQSWGIRKRTLHTLHPAPTENSSFSAGGVSPRLA